MNTIYKPKGKAAEYGEYALNIYEGCLHGCIYCYAPKCLYKDKTAFHTNCQPRKGIVEATEKFLSTWTEKGKHVHLSFTCDPFPFGQNNVITRKIIRLIHESGNYVQILTKGYLEDVDYACLNNNDILGVSVSCFNDKAPQIEPNAAPPMDRIYNLQFAKQVNKCQKTFVSCEPVFDDEAIFALIRQCNYIDEFKFGKLNYMSEENPLYPKINWGEFGRECERLCKEYGRQYYIKDSLRAEMNK